VKPWVRLGEGHAPDGTRLALMRRDQEFVISADGRLLMSSRMHGSEEALATQGCAHLNAMPRPRVLVGGLGLGYTLRATLDAVSSAATVVVAELVAAVVEWNRGPLAPLAGAPLDDPRVEIRVEDVAATMRTSPRGFDAILLDVDNGPDAFTAAENAGLYDTKGIALIVGALAPGGVVAVWSAWEDRPFAARLRRAGLTVTTSRVRARLDRGGSRHVIHLGRAAGR